MTKTFVLSFACTFLFAAAAYSQGQSRGDGRLLNRIGDSLENRIESVENRLLRSRGAVADRLFPRRRAAAATPPNTLTAEEKRQGFVLLFDGKTVSPDIWQNERSIAGYPVKDGAIVCERGGNLFTKKEYGDFIFRFEFKLPPGGNNGVGIRAESVEKDAAYHGMEIQILDNSAEQYRRLAPYQYHGSVYGVVPAKRNAEKNDYQKPLGEWNYQEIIARGSTIKVVLNGETIVDADLSEFQTNSELTNRIPGLLREKGFIGFLGHGDPVQFRNIRIKSLD